MQLLSEVNVIRPAHRIIFLRAFLYILSGKPVVRLSVLIRQFHTLDYFRIAGEPGFFH